MSDTRSLGVYRKPCDNQPNVIPGLELIEPFYYVDWGSCRVYTTKSLMRSRQTSANHPSCFIVGIPGERVQYRHPAFTDICLGEFFGLMNEEEKEQFLENYEQLSKLLKFPKDLQLGD
jgi:hypothetical protein